MSDILVNILFWGLGLIVLILIVVIINVLLTFINRLIKGAERVEAIALVCQRDTIEKYVPEAISPSPWGTTQIDTKRVISKLFHHAVSDSKLERWIKSGKIFLCLQTRKDVANSAQRSIEAATREISQSSIPKERLQKSKVYSITSKGTEEALKAHLVIVGNIPSPPIQLTIEPF